MDPRKPDCTNEKLANTAGCIATATKLAGAAAKGIGEALPAPIKAAGHVAKVAEAAMKDKTPGAGFVETVACATAKVGTQVVMGAPLAARAAAVGAAAMPLPIPLAKGGAAAVAVAAAAPGIAILTEPYGKVAEKTCHAAFDFCKKIAPHVPNPFAEPVVPKQKPMPAVRSSWRL